MIPPRYLIAFIELYVWHTDSAFGKTWCLCYLGSHKVLHKSPLSKNALLLYGLYKKEIFVKARSHDPFLRIRFLVPKTGSRRSDGPISRFRFCDETVGRSFVVCSHDPFFRTNTESSIWRQNDHAKFVGAFHLSKRVSDENRACSIFTVFSKLWIRLLEGHF